MIAPCWLEKPTGHALHCASSLVLSLASLPNVSTGHVQLPPHHPPAAEVERAERDPHHKMALVFRSYLGLASRWAIIGDADRRLDYQIWCGPAIGAFNEWARGSFLEASERRDVVTLGMNLLVGAAALARVGWLRTQGVALPRAARRFLPRDRADLAALVACE